MNVEQWRYAIAWDVPPWLASDHDRTWINRLMWTALWPYRKGRLLKAKREWRKLNAPRDWP